MRPAEAPTSKSSLPEVLANRLGYLLALNHFGMRDVADAALEPVGLPDVDCNPKHVVSLIVLAEEGPLSQHDLGKVMRVDRTTMVAIVDELERAGYLERRRNPSDRRAYALEVTASGREWLEPARRALYEAEQKYLEPLSREERRQLTELLQRLLVGQQG